MKSVDCCCRLAGGGTTLGELFDTMIAVRMEIPIKIKVYASAKQSSQYQG